ncbi:MAG: Gfo/Idh/MocA family oxidoreductase [Verrucomicrobiota bacterium]|nr:Gfo/Idh/MocA family oxidoreductase [Limisphaera sp.]MDW8382158.1 Gfo/Idh/MocA family oxidoreductase [Verrucomicrobiota bacterium]
MRRLGAGLAGVAVPLIVPARVFGGAGQMPPSERIRLAGIGVGGMGAVNLQALAPYCEIVALCDVDEQRAAESFARYPSARRFKDFRRMFDEMADRFDAVMVATPDHTHAVASMMAIRHRKHVYCEKPLAHSVVEIRALMRAAAETGVVTQLGNQGHSFDSIRDCVEWIQAGAVGRVHTVYCGCEAVNSGLDRLAEVRQGQPIPPTLDWDLWLGPVPWRPYHSAYLPGAWRGWTAFGSGTIGDWVCHVVDPVFWALDLGAPRTVLAKVKDYDPRTQGEAYPKGDVVTFEFPARGDRGPVTLHWYSGTEKIPRPEGFDPEEPDVRTGAIVVGDRGMMVYGSHGASHVHLVPDRLMKDFQRPPRRLPRGLEHHRDWIDAIRGGRKAGADFSYGGPLTELAMLGIIAIRMPGVKLEWDAAAMRFTNVPEANRYLGTPYREGWRL